MQRYTIFLYESKIWRFFCLRSYYNPLTIHSYWVFRQQDKIMNSHMSNRSNTSYHENMPHICLEYSHRKMLVNDKWLSKTAFCLKRNGFSLVSTLFFSLGKGLFPRVGILHSQRGMFCSQRGNYLCLTSLAIFFWKIRRKKARPNINNIQSIDN